MFRRQPITATEAACPTAVVVLHPSSGWAATVLPTLSHCFNPSHGVRVLNAAQQAFEVGPMARAGLVDVIDSALPEFAAIPFAWTDQRRSRATEFNEAVKAARAVSA